MPTQLLIIGLINADSASDLWACRDGPVRALVAPAYAGSFCAGSSCTGLRGLSSRRPMRTPFWALIFARARAGSHEDQGGQLLWKVF